MFVLIALENLIRKNIKNKNEVKKVQQEKFVTKSLFETARNVSHVFLNLFSEKKINIISVINNLKQFVFVYLQGCL